MITLWACFGNVRDAICSVRTIQDNLDKGRPRVRLWKFCRQRWQLAARSKVKHFPSCLTSLKIWPMTNDHLSKVKLLPSDSTSCVNIFVKTPFTSQSNLEHYSLTCPSNLEFGDSHFIIITIIVIVIIIIATIANIIVIIIVLPRSSTGIVSTSCGPLSSPTADLYPDSFYLGHVQHIRFRKMNTTKSFRYPG